MRGLISIIDYNTYKSFSLCTFFIKEELLYAQYQLSMLISYGTLFPMELNCMYVCIYVYQVRIVV